MECFYLPNLDPSARFLEITGKEAHHIRVLRLQVGDHLLISDGKGNRLQCELVSIEKHRIRCLVLHQLPEQRLFNPLIIAPAILHDRHRWEFLLEKCTELGATHIYPLRADRCVKTTFNKERGIAKLVAALKQSQRAYLPSLADPLSLENFLQTITATIDHLIITHPEGNVPTTLSSNRIAVCIGPEGGWTPHELQLFAHYPKARFWNLGPYRLRSETAATVVIAHLWCLVNGRN